MQNARAFKNCIVAPPFEDFGWFDEEASAPLVWRNIMLRADVPDQGRRLFAGSLAQRNALWRHFGSYVRQAKAYDDAARHSKGPSGALLQYYCALNLAKAELLTTAPTQIVNQKIAHGLSFNPTNAKTMRADFLRVLPGVFPLLYEKRTGVHLPPNTRLPVRRLLQQCQEIGWESEEAGFGKTKAVSAIHAWASTRQEAWSIFGIASDDFPSANDIAGKRFLKHYERVRRPKEWRDVFAVSRRFGGKIDRFFQSKLPAAITSGVVSQAAMGTLVAPVKDLIGPPFTEAYDAELYPGLFKSRELCMPPDLARYALTYYLSSIVRYKPSQVDPLLNARQAWLAESFVSQARNRLITASLSGIEQTLWLFFPVRSFRT